MVVSAASTSFLRPVLTPFVTDELNGSRLFAASLFSLSALVGVISESVATTFISARIGIRNTVVLGLLICLAGFRLLQEQSWLTLAIVLLVAGSSSSLVMTLTDLSQTTNVDISGISNSLSLLAAFTFSVGEILGTLGAGLLNDHQGSFQLAVSKWSHFLLIACVVVLAPYLIGLVAQFLSPLVVLLFGRQRIRSGEEAI